MKKNDELRSKSAVELDKELIELRRAQFGLRMQLATQSLTKNSEIARLRKQIARVHTFINQKAKAVANYRKALALATDPVQMRRIEGILAGLK